MLSVLLCVLTIVCPKALTLNVIIFNQKFINDSKDELYTESSCVLHSF